MMNRLWELTSRPHVSGRGGILTSRWERSRLNRGGRFPVLWRSPRNSGPHRDNFISKPSSLLTCAAFNADVGAFAARESKPPRADEARTPRAQRRHDVRVAIGMPRHIFRAHSRSFTTLEAIRRLRAASADERGTLRGGRHPAIAPGGRRQGRGHVPQRHRRGLRGSRPVPRRLPRRPKPRRERRARPRRRRDPPRRRHGRGGSRGHVLVGPNIRLDSGVSPMSSTPPPSRGAASTETEPPPRASHRVSRGDVPRYRGRGQRRGRRGGALVRAPTSRSRSTRASGATPPRSGAPRSKRCCTRMSARS